MRTTLEIDDGVLRAARVIADQSQISLGRAVSQLALRGLGQGSDPTSPGGAPQGFPTLPRLTEEHVITDDLVADHRDDLA